MQFLASLCAALLLAVSTTTSTTAVDPRELQLVATTSVAHDLLQAVNAVRATSGLQPLCLNSKLAAASQGQAADMAKGGFISPVGSSGSMPTARAESQGFNTTGVVEVVGAGYTNATVAISEWMKSTDYSQYLLGEYELMGAGNAFNEAFTYKSTWVLDFSKGGSGEACA